MFNTQLFRTDLSAFSGLGELGANKTKKPKTTKPKATKVKTPKVSKPKTTKTAKSTVKNVKYNVASDNTVSLSNQRSTVKSSNNGLIAKIFNPTDAPPSIAKSVSNSASEPKWYDKLLTLGSQAVAGFAPNSSIQTVGGVAPIYPVNQQADAYFQPQQQDVYQNQQNQFDSSQGVGRGVGQGIGSGLDGIINWGAQNPLIVIGGGVMLLLLFMKPPGRR